MTAFLSAISVSLILAPLYGYTVSAILQLIGATSYLDIEDQRAIAKVAMEWMILSFGAVWIELDRVSAYLHAANLMVCVLILSNIFVADCSRCKLPWAAAQQLFCTSGVPLLLGFGLVLIVVSVNLSRKIEQTQ